jgi:hypothetical protein
VLRTGKINVSNKSWLFVLQWRAGTQPFSPGIIAWTTVSLLFSDDDVDID